MICLRIPSILGAVALASGAAADAQPTASEIFALRTECGKIGEEWVKKHPLSPSSAGSFAVSDTIYSQKSNRCWIIISTISRISDEKWEKEELLRDAQTGAQIMLCHRTNIQPEIDYKVDKGDETQCAYIEEIVNDNLGRTAATGESGK